MFTGIVEELGTVAALETAADSARLTIHGPLVTSDAEHGASISVNGVCLTVVTHGDGRFSVDVMAETLARSGLGALRPGDRVNLERAMAASSRFGGHVVQGHVDGTGTITARTPGQRWEVVEVSLPRELAPYVVEKGSITVDGVSLTVVDVTDPPADGGSPDGAPADGAPADGTFTVSLIPTTLELTTLGTKGVGDPVNLEVDVLAKYVERLLATRFAPVVGS
ncbi:MAG TPA: riboflavin synthase [Ornithinibacter sp.]|nr:riboflavin synthase [Ornithinibacter sp.]